MKTIFLSAILLVLLAALVAAESGKGKKCEKQPGGCGKKNPNRAELDTVIIRPGAITLKLQKYDRGSGRVQEVTKTISKDERSSIEARVAGYLREFLIPDQVVRDFDTDVTFVAKAMGEKWSVFRNRLPKVISVNGSDPAIPHRVFNQYKVKATVTSQHSDDPVFSPIKPTTVVTKWVHNHLLANNTESVISEEVTRKTGTSTSMTSTVGGSVTASMTLNFWVASASASMSVGGSFSTTSTTEQEDVKTFMLQDTVTVSPRSSAKVVWNIMERDMKLTWTAQLKIERYFAVEIESDGLYFVPVTILPYFLSQYKLSNVPNTIVTDISGVMKSQTGTESTVTTIDFPLQIEKRFIDQCNDGISVDKAVKG